MNYLSNVIFKNKDQSLSITVPSKQLLNRALQIQAPGKQFTNWSKQNHADSYSLMQRIAYVWNHSKLTDQYLIYGKIDSEPFRWEMVPYEKCHTSIGRAVQQLQVLWRTVFGGITVLEKNRKNQIQIYKLLLNTSPDTLKSSEGSGKSTDPFCKQDTIERQSVIIGKKVQVLFNSAPIGFGGERLHFLVIPKEHRETFTDVSKEEYCESLDLTKKLVNHFKNTRKEIKNIYLFNKTGIDAGQTIKHWHLHVIFSTNIAQDFWGNFTVIKNILLGSSPMKKEDFTKKVKDFRKEFASIQSSSPFHWKDLLSKNIFESFSYPSRTNSTSYPSF
jgi:diadenosine tetraphosphate (Ap4A) HIT family hydrolase